MKQLLYPIVYWQPPKTFYNVLKVLSYWSEIKVAEENVSASEKILLTMHNLGVMRQGVAKAASELAQILQKTTDDVLDALNRHEADGYVKSYTDQEGTRRFYLTAVGIIKVCSSFT